MNIFDHHAYYSLGGRKAAEQIKELLKEHGFSVHANPDFSEEDFNTLGIDESRRLKYLDSRQPIGERKVILITFDSITNEAQNALLKTFEEPQGHSHYFLCLRREDELLPTLRSRLILLDIDVIEEKGSPAATDFLKMSLSERLTFSADFAESIKKGKRTKMDAIDLMNAIEAELAQNFKNMEGKNLKDFLELKQYVELKGSSVKNLLETVSMILPESK